MTFVTQQDADNWYVANKNLACIKNFEGDRWVVIDHNSNGLSDILGEGATRAEAILDAYSERNK